MHREIRGFTLIELLVVIAILAVLATVVVLVINPAELLRQARDASRIADLDALNKALSLAQFSQIPLSGAALSANTIYISYPDSASAACTYLNLPAAPQGWDYACVSSDALRKTDGTGWIPVNFSAIASGVPLASLPVDPVNATSTGQYYRYITNGGQWELLALPEAQKNITAAATAAVPGFLSSGSSVNILSATPSSGMVGWWKLDEGVGASAIDSSGGGHTGVLSAGTSWVPGIWGSAVAFDGASGGITAPLASATTNALTATMWVYASSTPTGIAYLAYNGNSGASGWGVVLSNGTCGAGTTVSVLLGGFACDALYSTFALTVQQWTHVSVTWDGALWRLYIDGAFVGSGSGMTPITPAGNVTIGSNFDGVLDDVRIYNRALSAGEIEAIYLSGGL